MEDRAEFYILSEIENWDQAAKNPAKDFILGVRYISGYGQLIQE